MLRIALGTEIVGVLQTNRADGYHCFVHNIYFSFIQGIGIFMCIGENVSFSDKPGNMKNLLSYTNRLFYWNLSRKFYDYVVNSIFLR